MNKLVLGIVVVLAVGIVSWFFFSQKEVTAPEAMTGNETTENIEAEGTTPRDGASLEGDMIEDVIVTYTDTGFEPKSITINQGQAVRFVNQSSRGMWVGSDSHPTHTNYPVKAESDCLGSSFDACRGIPAGESWSFTFTEAGTWGYHNHTQAGHRGTVIVE